MTISTPEGWSSKTLDEVNDPSRPICYGILMPGPDVPEGVPYVKVRNIRGGRVLMDEVHRTTPEIDSKYARSRLSGGDLLVSIRGTYGRTAIVPTELHGGNITQDSARVAPIGAAVSFVHLYLDSPSAQAYLKAVARGVAVKGVNIGDLRKLPVPVPPPEEQHEIVNVLEDHLSRLDAAVGSVRAVAARAEVLRRAILRDAFNGRLISVSPEGWTMSTLDALNDPGRPICYGILMPGHDHPGGVPYVKVRNIRGGRVELDNIHRTTPEIEGKYSRSRLRVGDLLVSIRGTYGRTAPVPLELDGGNITQDTARIAPVGVEPQFLLRFLDSPPAQNYFKAVARGVAVKGVNIGDLRKLPVPLPPLEHQRSITAALDEQLPLLDAAVAAAQSAERMGTALRRSLLHAAFTGQLTETWRKHRG